MKGVGWKVKSGQQIQVWDHNWIPSKSLFRPFCNKSAKFPNMLVSDLIDHQSHTWNMSTISCIFLPIDIDSITAIPILVDSREDEVFWMPNRKGDFSVKSVYFFAKSFYLNNTPPTSKPYINNKSFWKFIWSSSLPIWVSVSIWRAFRDRIPTRSNLSKKGIDLNIICPFM